LVLAIERARPARRRVRAAQSCARSLGNARRHR